MIYYNSTGSTVKSPLVPAGSNATHYDMFGVGGYREVDTLNDLHYINSKLLLTGCLVYVRSENEIYKYEGSGNFKILYYDKWLQLEECVKNIKSLLLEDAKLWKAVNANIENINVLLLEVNTNTLNITELTNKLDSLDFKNYELSLNQSSDKNSVVLKYKKDNSITTADLPIATKNTPGEIKLGDSTLFDSTNTKNYPVLLDNNNRAYVNVPWSDTVTKSNTYRIAFKTPSKNIAHSIELSGSDSSTSSADIPIASETLLGEIKLGNPNLLGKNKCYPLQYNDDDGAYVQVPWTDTVTNPEDITTQFTSFVFTRSTTNPGQPEGGTYNNPIPTNTNSKGELIWSDGIPEGENPVWSSNAIFTNKNVTSIIWSEPILLTGALGIQGCVLRNRGYWKSDVNDYINQGEYAPASATEIRYIDYVFLKGSSTDSTTSDKCYRVNYASQIHSHINDDTRNGIVKVPAGTTPGSNNEYWVEATSLEFAYIKDLIALLISALTITADEFLVKRKLTDNSTQIVAGMVKGDTNTTKTEDNVVFFAGTSATDTSKLNTKEAKTYITEGGSGQVANGNFKWDENGNIKINNDATQFNTDGSGQVANGNINWDKDGNLNLKGNIEANCLKYNIEELKPTVNNATITLDPIRDKCSMYLIINNEDTQGALSTAKFMLPDNLQPGTSFKIAATVDGNAPYQGFLALLTFHVEAPHNDWISGYKLNTNTNNGITFEQAYGATKVELCYYRIYEFTYLGYNLWSLTGECDSYTDAFNSESSK